MPAYIERFLGNRASNPWWLGMPEVESLADLCEGDVPSEKLRDTLFNYTVQKRQAFIQNEDGMYVPAPGQYGLECSDGVVIPAMVGEKYEVFQPQLLIDVGDALTRAGCMWHTAGILQERRRLWGLALIKQFDIGGEQMKRYLLFWNSFDGSSRFLAKPVNECVVCANTAEIALSEKGKPIVAERHTGNAEDKMRIALELLGAVEERFEEEKGFIQQLQDLAYTRDQFRILACQILTGKDDEDGAIDEIVKAKGRKATNYSLKGDELMRVYDEGAGASARGQTGWRAVQAVNEYIDWQRGRMQNWKRTNSRLTVQGMESNWFGEGNKTKNRAAKLVLRKGS
jgi:phage/plasmid-like protein (TIGR03299 family)